MPLLMGLKSCFRERDDVYRGKKKCLCHTERNVFDQNWHGISKEKLEFICMYQGKGKDVVL